MTNLTAPRRSVGDARAPVFQHLVSLLAQRRGSMVVVGFLVLAAAAVELVPPLVIRDVVDRHLTAGRSDGLPALALLYLLAVAAMQAMTFLYGYLAAAVAQGVLSDLRTRLFAHVQRLPASYFDRVPIGDVINRGTADVETLDTVFSSGVALLLANLVRLVTIAAAMVALSPALSLVAALIAAPLVLVTRVLQVRVRQAERESRVAIGVVDTRLQVDLRGIEVIRAFGREPEFIAGFGHVLSRGLAAFTRSSVLLGALHADDGDTLGHRRGRPARGRHTAGIRSDEHLPRHPHGVPPALAALLPADHGPRRGVANRSGSDGGGGTDF